VLESFWECCSFLLLKTQPKQKTQPKLWLTLSFLPCRLHLSFNQNLLLFHISPPAGLEPVWLCGCGCVFFKTQLQPFGYKKKAVYCSLGPTCFLRWKRSIYKARITCFFALFNEQCN
jgi:hypothetical protein